MKCTILHDIPRRMRVHLCCGRMTLHHADVLEYYLRTLNGVQSVKVMSSLKVRWGARASHIRIGIVFFCQGRSYGFGVETHLTGTEPRI